MNRGRRHTSPTRQIVDADGNIYTSVVIGTQTWLVENLKTTHFNNGDAIPYPMNNSDWIDLATPAYCMYNRDDANKTPYGALYNFYVGIDGRGVAPIGYHVPTKIEIDTLNTYLGTAPGGKLKEIGTTHWNSPNTSASNSSGFSAVGTGLRASNGPFSDIKNYGYLQTVTSYNSGHSWFFLLSYNLEDNTSKHDPKSTGMSIRCIKD